MPKVAKIALKLLAIKTTTLKLYDFIKKTIINNDNNIGFFMTNSGLPLCV